MTDPDKKILVYYSDQVTGSSHASVESLFYHELNLFLHVIVIYYDRQVEQTAWLEERKIVIPYRKRAVLMGELGRLLPLETVDYVIVRNIFSVYKNALNNRKKYAFKVLFHYSFPHTYRPYYAEQGFGLTRLRKFIQYRLSHFLQVRLMQQADGFLPISERMPAMLGLPEWMQVFPIHSGVDFQRLPQAERPSPAGPVQRFLYMGTLDPLRRMDVVLQAFDRLDRDDWQLDLITAQEAFARQLVERVMLRRASQVVIVPAIPRERLYATMTHYQMALCLIPPTSLYQVSSPLKLMEYYAMGLPVVMSMLPECLNLFGAAQCGWFAEFDPASIHQALEKALNAGPEQKHRMGQTGGEIVRRERNYSIMAARFAEFLRLL